MANDTFMEMVETTNYADGAAGFTKWITDLRKLDIEAHKRDPRAHHVAKAFVEIAPRKPIEEIVHKSIDPVIAEAQKFHLKIPRKAMAANIRHASMAYAGGMIAPRQRKRWNNKNVFTRKVGKQKRPVMQRFLTWIREVSRW